MLNACWDSPEPDYQKMFSCKVNGQLWVPAGDPNPFSGLTPPPIWVTSNYYLDSIQIIVQREIQDKNYNTLSYEVINLYPVGLKVNSFTVIKDDGNYRKDGCGYYITDSTKSNFIKTTSLDTVNRIVKGVFQLECTGSYCHDNVKITEGRFEVKY